MSETIESLKRQIQDLSALQSCVVKTGEIVFINPPESPTPNFSKIEVGIDCSEVSPSGKLEVDFLGFQVSKYRKDMFAEFDTSEGSTPKYKVGDKIKVICSCGARQTYIDKNTQLTKIINNCDLQRVKMVEVGALLPSEKANEPVQSEANSGTGTTDDAPF